MEYLNQFFSVFVYYIQELWLSLLIGFVLSGLVQELIPSEIVEKHLGDKGLKPILLSSTLGALLPVCCIGALPIAMTFQKRGARLGAVMAFLVATPATSISALIVTWKLLGGFFTFYIFVAVILMALCVGIVTDKLTVPVRQRKNLEEGACCEEIICHNDSINITLTDKVKRAVKFSFYTLPKELGVELLLGIALASFIQIFDPLQEIIRIYLTGVWGYAFVIVFGLVTYVCSTASVPMADAFIHGGMDVGQAMTFLLVGPITSSATIFIFFKKFGVKMLIVYLTLVSLLSLIFGYIYSLYFA